MRMKLIAYLTEILLKKLCTDLLIQSSMLEHNIHFVVIQTGFNWFKTGLELIYPSKFQTGLSRLEVFPTSLLEGENKEVSAKQSRN